ncbi:sulfite exporter TauE/SafE family protein [Endozoicomonas sp. 8E]|uniref:sulfite exporter TauE/SafE family protein n=1 Tax=Endozoicomonas sp. 8E TaxID=3035692 RepID=UPI002938F66C|nr:sulfite exporter TauE/SafE family protein [Endozoicomonas sp. 8E]WOG27446.1 sulfite exporter TauE/SafE family protein [Endozoicomonas sp. 8E]
MMGLATVFVLFAGLVRGYSGFGFAIIAALCLSLVYSPFDAVAIALTLDLLSSLCLLPGVRRQVNRRLLTMLSLGMLGAIPVSLLFISVISAGELKMMIAGFSLIAGALIMFDLRFTWLNHRYAMLAGALSGFGMTTASAGGPPLVLYLLNLSLKAIEIRATAILFFILSSATSLLGLLYVDAISARSIQFSLVLFPVAMLGSLLGKKLFDLYPDSSPKNTVAPILMMLALLTIMI